METLYPIGYGTRLVTLDVLIKTFTPNMHPEAARRGFNFIEHQGGKFGIGSGYRPPGTQPDGKPGFAPPGASFHEGQMFPSGRFYAAWDLVVVNPGYVHRAPLKNEVPWQGSYLATQYGFHMNVSTESWHGQPVPLDGHGTWVMQGRWDLDRNYKIQISPPREQPPQPPVPTPPSTNPQEIIVQFKSRNLFEGYVGNDVKFFQRQLNDLAGRGLLLDGHYGPKMAQAVKDWQDFFGVRDVGLDGVTRYLGENTQRSIIEITLVA